MPSAHIPVSGRNEILTFNRASHHPLATHVARALKESLGLDPLRVTVTPIDQLLDIHIHAFQPAEASTALSSADERSTLAERKQAPLPTASPPRPGPEADPSASPGVEGQQPTGTRMHPAIDFALEHLGTLTLLSPSPEQPVSFPQSVLEGLVAFIRLRDPATGLHIDRVAAILGILARRCDFSPTDLEWIRLGALLHDLGKLAIPQSILTKRTPLTSEEITLIRRHPVIGYDFLKHFPLPDLALNIIRHHHERFDGKGYPDGLAGDAIPWVARLAAVADAYDAMVSPRPYRSPLSPSEARREIEKGADSQFDPEACALFLEVLDEVEDRYGRPVVLEEHHLLTTEELSQRLKERQMALVTMCDHCPFRGPNCPNPSCQRLARQSEALDPLVTELARRQWKGHY